VHHKLEKEVWKCKEAEMANSQEARRPSFQISLAKQAQKTTTKLGVPRGNCFNASKEKEFIYGIGVVDSKE